MGQDRNASEPERRKAPPWHLRRVRGLLYAGLSLVALAIPLAERSDEPTPAAVWIGSRELFGLWALALLLAAMLIGPLTFAWPGIPLKAHLILGRRAVGISAFCFALCHSASYVVPVGLRDWHELLSPGVIWIAGLILGSTGLVVLGVLAFTSTDHLLIQIGGKRWKAWQEAVYWLLPVALVHAMSLGADFGLNRAPDVKGGADLGSLIGFSALFLTWLGLFVFRARSRARRLSRAAPPEQTAP